MDNSWIWLIGFLVGIIVGMILMVVLLITGTVLLHHGVKCPGCGKKRRLQISYFSIKEPTCHKCKEIEEAENKL